MSRGLLEGERYLPMGMRREALCGQMLSLPTFSQHLPEPCCLTCQCCPTRMPWTGASQTVDIHLSCFRVLESARSREIQDLVKGFLLCVLFPPAVLFWGKAEKSSLHPKGLSFRDSVTTYALASRCLCVNLRRTKVFFIVVVPHRKGQWCSALLCPPGSWATKVVQIIKHEITHSRINGSNWQSVKWVILAVSSLSDVKNC